MAADRNKDDIAAALHGLSGGADAHAEHFDEARVEHDAHSPSEAAPPSPQRPAVPNTRPPAPSQVRDVPPLAPAPAGPAASSSARSRPASPLRPAAPTAADPQLPEPEEDDPAGAPFTYDPSAAATVGSRSPAKPVARPRRTPMFKSLGFRRTIIPVMLSSGVMMIVMAAAKLVVDEEAPLARLPGWISLVLVVTGLIMLALGAANMMMVRTELARRSS